MEARSRVPKFTTQPQEPGIPRVPMLDLRDDFTATLLASGKVLVAGGIYNQGNTDIYLASAELYDENPSCPEITIAPSSLPSGTLGTAYSQTITASGGRRLIRSRF